MNLINFQLVTPERTVLSKELTSLSCPTPLGQITILPEHIPLVSTLVAGELHAKTQTDDFFVFVAGGFVEIKPGSEVIVLADAAEHHFEIDQKQAEEAKKKAEEAMKNRANMSDQEYAKVAAVLQQSLARLNIARSHAHRKQPTTLDQ